MKRAALAIAGALACLTAAAEPWTLDDMPPTNTVYTSQEVDAAIRAAEPGDYATVSNRAMTALQPVAPVSGGRIVVSNQDGGIEESFSSLADFVDWTSAEQFANKSELGTAASKDVPTSGNAIASQVVMGNDTRLSDARTPTAHTHVQADVDGLADALAGKAETNHAHRLEYNYPSLYTDQQEGTMFKANNKNEIVPAVPGTDYAVGNHTHSTSEISDFPANISYFWNDTGYLTAHQSLAPATNYTDSVAATLQAAIAAAEPGNYATVSNRAMSALQSYTETDPTVPAWAKAANKPAYTAAEVGALAVEADPVFAAWVATNVPSGGGGADMGEVTNLVTDLLAEAPDATALAAQKAIIADLWQRVDALEDADGSDVLTAAQTEALVNDRVSSWESMIQTWSETHGAMPIQSTNVTQIALSSSSSSTGLAIELSPLRATEYSGSVSIGIASVSGVGLNPCWLAIKSGVTSVSFPSGSKVKGNFSSGNDNFYRVSRVSGGLIVEKVYP